MLDDVDMRLLKTAKSTITPANEGWLPDGAIPPTPPVPFAVDLEIRQAPEGIYLISRYQDRDSGEVVESDTWHESIADAIAQAEWQFGVSGSAWRDVV